jgi:hypothetical protein
LALVAVPPVVVTEIAPVVAPEGTCAVIFVPVLTTNVGSGVPLKATAVVVPKAVPRMITLVPTGPEVGLKLVMVGGAMAAACDATDRVTATAQTTSTEERSVLRDMVIPPSPEAHSRERIPEWIGVYAGELEPVKISKQAPAPRSA